MNRIDVSVIITTKNEEKNIGRCLTSIREQSYPQDRIEIIVVDNNSTDGTKSIALDFTTRVFDCGPERSAQRNLGISQAGGKYILYLDADMILSQDVLSECYQKCEKDGLVALYIPERIIGSGFWIKVRDFERSFYNTTCIDAVRFVRREAALSINGFDENLNGPEDWDFDRRIIKGGRVGIINSCLYHNEGSFSIREYLLKKAYYLPGFKKYIEKWGGEDPILKKQLGFWYRYLGAFVENGRWRRLLTHPILAIGLYVLRLRVGLSYLVSRRGGRDVVP